MAQRWLPWAAAAAILAATACAREAPPPPPSEQTLVGLSKARLIACAGKPAADFEQAGREFITYGADVTVNVGYLQSTPRVPVVGSFGMGGKGNLLHCEARFVLKGGSVEALDFHSEPPQEAPTTKSLCAPIVAPCFQHAP